jgi:hypothetical protein
MKADKEKIKIVDEKQARKIRLMRALRFGLHVAGDAWFLYHLYNASRPRVVPAYDFFHEDDEGEIVLLPANPQEAD